MYSVYKFDVHSRILTPVINQAAETRMILHVTIDNRTYPIDIPKDVLDDGETFYQKMDRDMDKGWQMCREYVPNPNFEQRCQIAADRLLTSLHKENKHTLLLMAGYILNRLPGVTRVNIDSTGNMQETRFYYEDQ